MTTIDHGEAEILEWRRACLRQIASSGGDAAMAAEIERLAQVLRDELRARTRRAAVEKDA